jgi:hypothetical protein
MSIGMPSEQAWQQMQFGLFRAAVPDRDLDQDVRRRCLRVLDKDVEIAVLAENSGVDQFI